MPRPGTMRNKQDFILIKTVAGAAGPDFSCGAGCFFPRTSSFSMNGGNRYEYIKNSYREHFFLHERRKQPSNFLI